MMLECYRGQESQRGSQHHFITTNNIFFLLRDKGMNSSNARKHALVGWGVAPIRFFDTNTGKHY